MAEILETGDNPLGYFPFICKLDSLDEVDDQEAWHKANPSMEVYANSCTSDPAGLSGNAEASEQEARSAYKEIQSAIEK